MNPLPPAKIILTVLSDYMRVSMDLHPYHFYSATKTVTFAATNSSDAPLSTIRLNTPNGTKYYKKHTFNIMVMESQFVNLYSGLFLMPKGYPVAPPFANRDDSIPELEITQAIRKGYNAKTTTPPPHMLVHEVQTDVPLPRGEDTFCLIRLDDLVPMKFDDADYDDTNGAISYKG